MHPEISEPMAESTKFGIPFRMRFEKKISDFTYNGGVLLSNARNIEWTRSLIMGYEKGSGEDMYKTMCSLDSRYLMKPLSYCKDIYDKDWISFHKDWMTLDDYFQEGSPFADKGKVTFTKLFINILRGIMNGIDVLHCNSCSLPSLSTRDIFIYEHDIDIGEPYVRLANFIKKKDDDGDYIRLGDLIHLIYNQPTRLRPVRPLKNEMSHFIKSLRKPISRIHILNHPALRNTQYKINYIDALFDKLKDNSVNLENDKIRIFGNNEWKYLMNSMFYNTARQEVKGKKYQKSVEDFIRLFKNVLEHFQPYEKILVTREYPLSSEGIERYMRYQFPLIFVKLFKVASPN